MLTEPPFLPHPPGNAAALGTVAQEASGTVPPLAAAAATAIGAGLRTDMGAAPGAQGGVREEEVGVDMGVEVGATGLPQGAASLQRLQMTWHQRAGSEPAVCGRQHGGARGLCTSRSSERADGFLSGG